MRGNPDNLRQAARDRCDPHALDNLWAKVPEPMRLSFAARKSAAAQARAEQGLREIIRRNEPITFRGLAQTAGVSLDFLYRCTPIRRRVQQLRAQQQNTPTPAAATPTRDETPSSRRPHPHRPAHRTQTASPRRDQRSQTSARGRTRRELGTTSPSRLPSSPRRHHDTLTLHLQTRTQTIYLRKHTNSRSLPQIREFGTDPRIRHSCDYAEVVIMPRFARTGWSARIGGVKISA